MKNLSDTPFSAPAENRDGQPLFGPLTDPDTTEFRLWAPGLAQLDLVLKDGGRHQMAKRDDGFWTVRVDGAGQGTRYRFRTGELEFPDLASRQQDGDAAGWSIVRAPMAPSTRSGPIRPWHETVICEVHIGTVSPEGTFNGLCERLEHFRDAGYTCLEIMPINEFPGSRNWGYDGTLIFAPESAYGTPEELRALVDRAHDLGLSLVLDVVYNHFGDHANFARDYVPEWFDPEVETPWGPGIDVNKEIVRQFYFENARMWLTEYDFDGLRFDSVHEIKSATRDSFLGDLAKSCRAAKPHARLIEENAENLATWLERNESTNEPVNFTAQWNDDMHHVLAFLVSGEGRKTGYDDPSTDPYADLEKALVDGFVHDGEADGESDGTTRGGPGGRLPPDSFVTYIENHDQIGNRADGTRLSERIAPERLDFAHFVKFLAPQIPLCFMGDEGNLGSPFPFFVDLPPGAAEAVRADRYVQMREMFNEDVPDGALPDPNDPQTFEAAKLPWEDFHQQGHRDALDRFRMLAGFRRDHVWPLAATPCLDARSSRQGNSLIVNWEFEAGTLSMALNPVDSPCEIACVVHGTPVSTGTVAQAGDNLQLGPWSAVAWSSRKGG